MHLLRKGIAFLMHNFVYVQNPTEKERRIPCRCSKFISYLDFNEKYTVFKENGKKQ